MTKDERLTRLQSIEWSDIEFKEASWAVPRDALTTVSAFANTAGGHVVFGVKQANGAFSVTGVTDADNMQNAFLGQVRDKNKISVFLPINGEVHALAEGIVLVFYVPEASRQQKPVYLDGNPKKAYVRRGARDDTCTSDELLRFIRDADSARFDSEPLLLDAARCFDASSVRWYRERFAVSNPGRDSADDDGTFLRKWGFLVERDGVLRPTRAAIFVLGADEYVRQELPRMVVDVQFYYNTKAGYSPDVRWGDRLMVEENLIKAWHGVVDFFFRHSERPFSIDRITLRRDDDPPDYRSFREAAINLLIHQDFGDATRQPVIRIYRDQIEFFNPGDAFATREQLLDPGDKDLRNPGIVAAFRRIGLSDQGGTGMGAIFAGWRKLGYLPPEIENDKARKSFRLRLVKETLITEPVLRVQTALGIRLTEQEIAVVAFSAQKGRIDITDIKALTEFSGPDARQLVQRLAAQGLLVQQGEGGNTFTLTEKLRLQLVSLPESASTGQVTAQVTAQATAQVELDRLSEVQWRIVNYATKPRSLTELLTHTGYRQRQSFVATHLEPLLTDGVLRLTLPDKPRSPNQRYVLTETGIKLKLLHEQQAAGRTEEQKRVEPNL
ncbi:hypothetical protein AGMMS50225_22220 [Betaproteobacteria bacterium]|nr:hypothetical protein AGMMS50225_22220 [Betaproteobacteria bacterium]